MMFVRLKDLIPTELSLLFETEEGETAADAEEDIDQAAEFQRAASGCCLKITSAADAAHKQRLLDMLPSHVVCCLETNLPPLHTPRLNNAGVIERAS